MSRIKMIFIAFTGRPIEQAKRILKIKDDYECWDLKKFTLDEFVVALKEKIPPINNNVLRCYKIEEETKDISGITKKQYEQCSWGLLIPETIEEGVFSYGETMLILNLYSPNFLYPVFYAADMGIQRQASGKSSDLYYHSQDHHLFITEKFVSFYKNLLEQSKYGSWHLDRIQSWNGEDWRLFVAILLYSGLKDFENFKTSFGWQRESTEMATILESLFTAGDTHNEEIIYRLCKRVSVLLSGHFPNIEKDIRELYRARSAFVHGSFFLQIAKESPKANNNIPNPDFNLLYRHKEYVRFALVAYLHLAKVINAGKLGEVKSVMSTLEQAIIDIPLREKISSETKKILSLMPRSD